MITNTAPAKMIFQNSLAAYKSIYIQHSIFTDLDVYDRSFWLTNPDNSVVRRDYTDVSRYSITITGLATATTYKVQGAFVDAIIDSELLATKFSLNLSDELTITTKTPPKITAAYSTSQPVDVGVGAPIINIETTGDGDYCTIQLQVVGETTWNTVYQGALLPKIQFGGVPIGQYRVRIAGFISLPDGVTIESSGVSQFASVMNVTYNFTPPSAPTGMTFKVANIKDGKERYDLRVGWSWTKGTGANVREFILEYVTKSSYQSTGWAKSQKVNVGAAQEATLFSFPFQVPHIFRAASVAWGPDSQSVTYSSNTEFTITETTPIDNSFTNETGIEVNYAHIMGKLKDSTSGNWLQTFLVDAKTGAVSIGLLDSIGKAPISFDPIKRIVNVDGRIITNIINAASFVLTNLTGQDNPALYTQGKQYGDNNAGIFIGMNNTTLKPNIDIGNGTKFLRFDGDNFIISSGVQIGTPTGNIPISEGIQGKQTVFIYQLNTVVPAIPTSQDYPPAGWYTSPPNRTNQNQNIYSSTGLLDPVTNKLVSGTNWALPVQWSGTQGIDGANGKDGTNGTNGVNGSRGPGFYTQAIPGLGGFSAAQANSFFQSLFGTVPSKYDVITQYNSSNPTIAFTRQWDGSSWTTPALVVHGNMVVDGTITAQKIVADNAFLSRLGVDIIYNRAAALSANPEANYTMKIDLANSFIHIR